MHFHMPTDEEIHTAFEQGEAAVLALFHDVAAQVTELAQQLAKQGAILHELQARLAKSSRNSSKPPSSDGYGKVKRTESLRKSGDKPNGGQPGHDGQTLMASERPMRWPAVRIVRRPWPLSPQWGMKSARCSIFPPSGSK
jgi:hypothetical protein